MHPDESFRLPTSAADLAERRYSSERHFWAFHSSGRLLLCVGQGLSVRWSAGEMRRLFDVGVTPLDRWLPSLYHPPWLDKISPGVGLHTGDQDHVAADASSVDRHHDLTGSLRRQFSGLGQQKRVATDLRERQPFAADHQPHFNFRRMRVRRKGWNRHG